MSLNLFDYGTRLRAKQQKQALRVAVGKRFVLRNDALIIGLIAMSGEHAGTWAVAVGEYSAKKPQIFRCGDPSYYPLQVDMWEHLERSITSHVEKSVEKGLPPQIIVANRKCWDVIAETADRVSEAHQNFNAKRLARFLMYANHRFFLDGDPSVITISELLSVTYVCGHESKFDGNLQSVMAWINGTVPEDEDLITSDDECFLPREIEDGKLADKFAKMKIVQQKVGQAPSSYTDINNSASYTTDLIPFVKERWLRIKKAVDLYRSTPLVDIPESETFQDIAAKEWLRFVDNNELVEHAEKEAAQKNLEDDEPQRMNFNSFLFSAGEDNVGRYIKGQSRYDTVKDATHKLAERNDYADQWMRTLVWRDTYERSRQFANGQIITGEIIKKDGTSTHVLVNHDMLRIRTGDEFTSFINPKTKVSVVSLRKTNKNLTVVVIAGEHDAEVGDVVTYGPLAPAPMEIVRKASSRRKKLNRSGWTHSTYKNVPDDKMGQAPAEILKIVNDARVI
jgi:hypothetical protein